MNAEVTHIGRRIARARETAGLTQAELAAEAGLLRTAVVKIEAGQQQVRALELVDMARVLGTRVEWLLHEGPPAVVAHRTRSDPSLDVAAIDQQLERFAREATLVASIAPNLGKLGPTPGELPASGQQAEDLAERARLSFGLDRHEPVRQIADLFAERGMFALSLPLGPETADAATVRTADGRAVAVVNSSNAVGRRRLALAHELGHALVNDEYVVDWRVSEYAESDRSEVLIDRFARAFLAPSAGFGTCWRDAFEQHGLRTAAVITASRFGVDMATLARRVTELDLASDDNARLIRSFRTTKADIVEHNLMVTYDMEGTSLPRLYVKAIIDAYLDEQLARVRALELLRGTFEEDDLPQRPDAHPDTLWSLL